MLLNHVSKRHPWDLAVRGNFQEWDRKKMACLLKLFSVTGDPELRFIDTSLIHCGLLMQYGHTYFGQRWFVACAKPLSKLMLTHRLCYRQCSAVAFTSEQFHMKVSWAYVCVCVCVCGGGGGGGGGSVSCGIIRRGPVSKPRKLERQMLQNIAGSFVGHIWHVKSQAQLHKNTLQWRHNERDGVSNHQSHDCLLNSLFRSKKTSQLRVTGLCAVNSQHKGPVTREMFPFDDVIMRYSWNLVNTSTIIRMIYL